MLYGYKRKESISTVVGAALNKEELNTWYDGVGSEHFTDAYQTDMMQHMTDDEFQPFQSLIYVFEHESADQQDAFIQKHQLLIGTHARAVDRCIDMINYDAPDEYDILDERTIEQKYGLDIEDKYDRRTDAQKEEDLQMREHIKELKAQDKLSSDSFSAPKKDNVYVTDIRSSVDADGNVQLDNVLAVKVEDEAKSETENKPKD